MGEDFIDKYKRFCGGSLALSILTGVNLAVGVGLWLTSVIMHLVHADSSILSIFFALSSDLSSFATHPWTLLTYMVTQFSLLHLLFNVLWLYWFGRLIYISSGDRGLLTVYILGGLTGGMAYIIASASGASAGAYLCGASASVLAIMSVVALSMPDYEIRLLLLGRVKIKWFALVCILLTLIGTGGASVGGSVAHLGGIAFGLTYGLWLRSHHKIRWIDDILRKVKSVLTSFTRRRKQSRPKNAEAMVRASQGRLSDHDRLDELLDKIRLSGYDSLTGNERQELNALSTRLRDSR